MMEFPALVYKDKGPYQRASGSYDYKLVESQEAHDEALSGEWFASIPDAVVGKPAEPVIEGAPTRDELETKATELGIKFDGRTSDRKLNELINAALSA